MFNWWEKRFLLWEFLLSLVIVGLFFLIVQKFGLQEAIVEVMEGNRCSIYGLLASVAGSLLGFVLTGVAIMLALADSNKLGILTQSKHYTYIYKVYMSTVKSLALTTVLSIIAVLYDREQSPNAVMLYLVLWAVILSIFRVIRCVWILEQIIKIATKAKK